MQILEVLIIQWLWRKICSREAIGSILSLAMGFFRRKNDQIPLPPLHGD